MKWANVSKLDRKSGVRWRERGAPVDSLWLCYDAKWYPTENSGGPRGALQIPPLRCFLLCIRARLYRMRKKSGEG
jgi:hypothetical protein